MLVTYMFILILIIVLDVLDLVDFNLLDQDNYIMLILMLTDIISIIIVLIMSLITKSDINLHMDENIIQVRNI